MKKMKPKGIIIYVDDDREDHELFKLALSSICDCTVVSAYDGDEAYRVMYERMNEIFLIVSDISMPKVTGLELKRLIENSPALKMKAIPFIYHTSIEDPVVVKEAYSLGIQGYMRKGPDFKKLSENLSHFITFWANTVHPNVYSLPISL